MSALGLVVVFAIVWWLLFFMVLPIGIQPARDRVAGQDAGAPDRPLLFRKVGAVTAAAVLLTAIAHVAAQNEWISLWSLLGTENGTEAGSN